MTKTKDIFLNIAANPNMTLEDLVSVGLTSENTVLLDRAQYAASEKVQDMFRDENGNFDEGKFNIVYDIAEQGYNILATDEANINLMDATVYDVDNIFVDPSKRKQVNVPFIVKLPNPDRLNTGVTRIGKTSERTLSQDEIAQTQQVLLNPLEVQNGAKPIYGEAPNESWFKDFWETRVMAAWDEDGVHVDPVTGKEVTHKKGDLKLNENGTYYYENLDGRSVYGKRILNKFNTLTTDGSAWNKYDFFDSDDIEQKSIGGSIAKNLALVGSMFIPYVGWGIAAASVVHQSAGLFATLGKMLAGADSPTLNNLEGWVKSTDRRTLKTEYAQQNMWCWENFIDLIGDTTAQLREQRAIFKFVPGLIKRDFKALSDKAMSEYAEQLAKEGFDNATKLSFKDLVKLAHKQNPAEASKQLKLLLAGTKDIYSARAQKAARKFIEDYYKLGEPIAKAYMTAITVQDTFGEAIQAGASNNEATLLTLGYAAAEAALLSTDLGKWIMPELRTERQRYKMIAKKLLEVPQETRDLSRQISRLSGESKKDWAKRLFNIGKDICTAEYSTMAKTLGSVAASGLGEGIEEVSEELLADFSKSCFNLVQQLQGDEVRMAAWKDMGNRYAMSFAGGIMGGGINAAASDYKVNKELTNMTSQQALQQLTYMTRNNELDDFWKAINKTTLASTELSTKLNENGTGYQPGTREDNQDLEAKRAIKKQIDLIESIINSENAKLDDSGLLATLIQADPSLKDLDPVKEYRMRALANSATAGRFLNIWNTTITDIVKNRHDQLQITSKYGDASQEKYSEEDKQTLKKLNLQLKQLQERKDAMLNGERTREYVRDALFEMSHAVSEVWDDWCTEIRFIESKTGKKYSDVSDEEKRTLREKYETLKSSTQYAEKVHELADIYETLALSASQGIQDSVGYLEQIKQDGLKLVSELNTLAKSRLEHLWKYTTMEEGIDAIQQVLDNAYGPELVKFDDSDELRTALQRIADTVNKRISDRIGDRTQEELSKEDLNYINLQHKEGHIAINLVILNSVFDKVNEVSDSFLKLGFAHPETKNMLLNMMESLKQYASVGSDTEYLFDGRISDEEAYEFDEKFLVLSKKIKSVTELPSTPLLEGLRKFQLSTTMDQSVMDLVTYLIEKENKESSDISQFQLDRVTLDQFKAAKQFLEMYRAAIVGARYDNVDIDSIVGFNTTLNELSGPNEGVKLAEIDSQTADLILEDINKLLVRLDYSEGVHKLNTGNKYNVQSKTALNKQFILHNKLKTFVSILEKEKEWADSEGSTELADLLDAINNKATNLNKFSGFNKSFEERNFTLSPLQRTEIERESILVQEALHKFLVKHIDGSEASVNKLAKLLTYDNFKGLIRENNEYLDQTSQDIDDSAFIWWVAATAALSPHDFYNNYRSIIGEESEGERPIAPIPTQELGVFALTAAVVNGDMFSTFGKALRKSLLTTWNKDAETRQKIREAYGSDLIGDDQEAFFKNNDFLPNFDNIIFVEGIAGSGKSTGVLKTWSKLLAKVNPDFISQKVLFAHTSKLKAENLAKSTTFTNFEAHDHDSLLSYMSADYSPKEFVDGRYTYEMNKDVNLGEDGILRAPWKVRELNPADVSKVIVIDEWSHYNQLEQELIQRFAQKYGVTVITMGDYDQLTPEAEIPQGDNGKFIITPTRNMTPRTAKLGVSMRTDNEIKNQNMYRMLAWRLHPTSAVELHYYEDDSGIYGDKNYQVTSSLGSKFDSIKLDVQKMVATLRSGEKIGYIYHDTNSELYKWITTTEGIKDHIKLYSEKDAHGEEAQYYIIENNRDPKQSALDYFRSVYTGITRSEQGSIVITGDIVGRDHSKNYGSNTGLSFITKVDTEMLPNTFTDEGTRAFSKNRKATFDTIFGDEEIKPFEIKPRTASAVAVTPRAETDEPSSISNEPTDNSAPTQTVDTSETTPTNIVNVPTDRAEVEPVDNYVGPLPLNQLLYRPNGKAKYTIIGETVDKTQYVVREIETGVVKNLSKDQVHQYSYLALPSELALFKVGDKVLHNGNVLEVKDVYLSGDKTNPQWSYQLGDSLTLSHSDLVSLASSGEITTYSEPTFTEEEIPEETLYELEGAAEYEAAADEQVESRPSEQQPQTITVIGDDINLKILGFTFNNFYVADTFDDDGNIEVTEYDQDRIDNGYGLHKLNPTQFTSKDQMLAALGEIRRRLEFSSNSDITSCIQRLTKHRDLTIKWAFISKTDNNGGKYTRFNTARSDLEFMGKEDTDVLRKTLSAIIYEKGVPVLELPIITLQSPHSIFKELKARGIASDITSKWVFGPKAPGQTYSALQSIIHLIDTKYANLPGFQNLKHLLRLWLFTSNGVKVLPSNWNLSEQGKNLGNFYITSRVSDNIKDHDFRGQWVSLHDAVRSDRFISSIMMNNTDEYTDPTSDITVPIFRKYVPYVFISDDPAITTDRAAAKRYIQQQLDSSLPKTVKVIPVSPPEISVAGYIEAMHRLISEKSNVEPYGNKYTPYRIFEAILKSSKAEEILRTLRPEMKEFVLEYVQKLENLKSTTIQTSGESNLAYKKRLAEVLNPILNSYVGEGSNRVRVYEKLRKALVDTCMYVQFGSEVVGDSAQLQLIQEVCKQANITGVLCKPVFEKDQQGYEIGGFAYKVKTQNKYDFPGQGSFRIFGKIDSPTYDLSVLTPTINSWSQDAHQGVTRWDREAQQEITYDNMWEFVHDDAAQYYLRKGGSTKVDINAIKQKCSKLFERLGMSDYNIDSNLISDCVSESEAIWKVVQDVNGKYILNPGAFVIQVGNKYKYGNIITETTPEFRNYLYKGHTAANGKYTLHFMDLGTNTQQDVDIELDPNSDSFKLIPLSGMTEAPTLNVAELKQSIRDSFAQSLLSRKPELQELIERILVYYDEQSNKVDVEAVNTVLSQSGITNTMILLNITNTLKLNDLENNREQDTCVNPIKIKFK